MNLNNNSKSKTDETKNDGFLYEFIFNEATDAIFIGDKNGSLLNTNTAAELLTGYSKADLTNMAMSDLFPKNILEEKPLRYEDVFSGTTIVSEREIKRKDGSLIFIRMKSKILSNGNLISFFSDITAEKKLLNTKIKYKDIVENVKEGIVILQKGKLKFANKATANMVGYSLDEIIDKPFLDFVFPDDREMIQKNHIARLKGNDSISKSYDFRLYTKSGEAFWVETHPILIEYEGKSAVQAFLIEINEKKNAQIALEKSEYKYRTVIENSLEAIMVMRDFKLLFYNNAFSDLLKLDVYENAIGIDIAAFIHTDDREKTIDLYNKRIIGIDVPNQYAIRVITTENEMLWVELKVIIVDWLGGLASLVFLTDITGEKKAKEALEKSENKFRDLVDNMKEGLVTINLDSQILYASQGLINILGYSADELVGKNFAEFIFEDDKQYAKMQFSKVVNKIPEHTEFRVHTKNGNIIWLIISGKPVIKNGSVVGISALIIDINSRRKAENSLKNSERMYRNLIDNSPIGIFIHQNGEIIYVNNALRSLTKFDAEYDFKNKLLSQFVVEKYHQNINERIKFIMETKGKSKLTEAKIISQSGKLIDILYLGQYIIYEGIPSIQVYVYDVTEFNKYKSDVNKLSQAVSQTSSAIVFSDVSGQVEYANSATEELTGFTAAEFKSGNNNIFKMLQVSKKNVADMWEIIKKGLDWSGDVSIAAVDGKIISLHVVVSPIMNNEQRVTHFVLIGEDITKKKEIEINLRKAKESAEKSDRLKSDFLAQMSHEIRTPINAIVSFTGLLNDELYDSLDEDQRISFDMIERAGDRIIRTIELLLNYSELKTKTYQPAYHRLEIGSEIISLLSLKYKRQAKSKNIKFEVNIDTDDSFFYGDRHALDQIFSNLIDNAIKYTKIGGVEVRLFKNEAGKITSVIKDTGAGISKDYLNDIFNPFSQEEVGYTRSFEGNGLGLAIVKEYCEINNIKINVESIKNVGTTFTLTF